MAAGVLFVDLVSNKMLHMPQIRFGGTFRGRISGCVYIQASTEIEEILSFFTHLLAGLNTIRSI